MCSCLGGGFLGDGQAGNGQGEIELDFCNVQTESGKG